MNIIIQRNLSHPCLETLGVSDDVQKKHAHSFPGQTVLLLREKPRKVWFGMDHLSLRGVSGTRGFLGHLANNA